MNIILFPNKQTSKPKKFLRKQTHKKPKKFQLKNKIIKSQNPKIPNQSKNTTQPTQKKSQPRKTHLKKIFTLLSDPTNKEHNNKLENPKIKNLKITIFSNPTKSSNPKAPKYQINPNKKISNSEKLISSKLNPANPP